MSSKNTRLLVVDLFCGAGGTTTGFEQARLDDEAISEVIACVNHDAIAIDSHFANHPDTVHFTEDIRTLKLGPLKKLAVKAQAENPDACLVLWASLECTNFSKAKGGMPRDADSRTLAEHLFRYIDSLAPDYIMIENVEEFMSWGPLDENGKPVDRRNGSDYVRWCNKIQGYGYGYEFRILNSADFGAYTSRKRYFGIFARDGLPCVFPQPTHAKKPEKGMFGVLEKWKAVRDVLDLDDKGKSIFTRKKPLSEKTLSRIYAGLVKFVAGGKEAFTARTYATASNSKGIFDVDTVHPTVTTREGAHVVQPCFIQKYYSGRPEGKVNGVDVPAGTIRTSDVMALVNLEFLIQYNGKAGNSEYSIENPSGTICSKDRFALTVPQFIMRDFTAQPSCQSIDKPGGSITSVPKMHLVSADAFLVDQNFNSTAHSIDAPAKTILACRKNHYLVNPSWVGNVNGMDEPSPVVIARQDKSPLYMVTTEHSDFVFSVAVYEDDSEMTRKIKVFMAMYGIVDIKMRMLKVCELLRIQGFPEGYTLLGSQQHQKKFIGNSVVPVVVERMAEALVSVLLKRLNFKSA